MKASIRAVTEKIFEWGSVPAGLLILGSCTYSGYEKSGIGAGVTAFVLSALGAAALVAFVFMITRTSADIRAIRKRIDGEPTEKGGAP